MKRQKIVTMIKDPDDVLDYTVDWRRWLHRNGDDEIESVSWEAETGLNIATSHHKDGLAIVWLSGGEIGKRYKVRCRIFTKYGRTKDRSFLIKIVES